jgi:23S rRNA pseudouridine1911/1915/1917 synthase
MQKTINIIIPDRLIGERVDVAISQMLPDYSRSKICSWIKSKNAFIDNKSFNPKDKIIGGEILTLQIKTNKNNVWKAQNIKLDLVFEDKDIIIINKPAGLVTHPGAGNYDRTLANALLYFDPNLINLDRAGIVHRLDKDTSGLMVVARSELAQKKLIEQLKNHQISRQYSAIVNGYIISGGKIDKPIGRHHANRIKQAVCGNGKRAVTNYRVVERFANYTHLKVMLETGRTHQIRVHMSYIGHSVIADNIYGGRARFHKKMNIILKDTLSNFSRQALHSEKLSLIHPLSGKKMTWKVSLPKDLEDLLQTLRKFDKI